MINCVRGGTLYWYCPEAQNDNANIKSKQADDHINYRSAGGGGRAVEKRWKRDEDTRKPFGFLEKEC
jgi:hypothetical protein